MADLEELCRAAIEAAQGSEQVEAYAEEARRTEVRSRRLEVESLEFSESRGVGVRVIRDGRLGYAYAADPSPDEVRETVAVARENARFSSEDPLNGLPDAVAAEPMPAVFREALAEASTADKVALATDLERAATTADARVTKVEEAGYGDAVSRIAIASTAGVADEYRRTDCWCAVATLAEEGDETQTGFAFRLAHEPSELEWAACGAEAAERAARLLGASKPDSARVPIVLDPHAAASFLGVLAGALTAEAVQKGRSLFAGLVGERIGSEAVAIVDDGRLPEGPGAAPFDDEGVPTGRTALIENGVLHGFLHNTYTARRGETRSTGNASRAGYRSAPRVSPSNLFIAAGEPTPEEILARAEGGVLIQDVSGVHSGTNPISGEFSVGATGLRIGAGGELAEPLREMTIASTVPDMLRSIVACGNDLRFFSSVGCPTVLIGEMTLAGA